MAEYTIQVDGRTLNSSIWSATFCETTGIPALWDKEKKTWKCQAHPRARKCLASFQNQSLMEKYAPKPPRWEPTKAEIAKARRAAKKFAVHHSFSFSIQQPLTLAEYDRLYHRLEAACGEIKHFSQGGPIPERP